jgi:hypothetical protein
MMDKADLKQDKKLIGSMINKHEKKMHQGMKPTKFTKGGVTNDMLKSMGRNMARVANQRGK